MLSGKDRTEKEEELKELVTTAIMTVQVGQGSVRLRLKGLRDLESNMRG